LNVLLGALLVGALTLALFVMYSAYGQDGGDKETPIILTAFDGGHQDRAFEEDNMDTSRHWSTKQVSCGDN
jgi:hypothetical protein